MRYKYPPLYKYIALFLFMKQYKNISSEKYLIISILFTLFVILLDYVTIEDQPNLLELFKGSNTGADLYDDLDDIFEDDLDDNYNNNVTTNNIRWN